MTAEFLEFELPNPENSIKFEDVEAIEEIDYERSKMATDDERREVARRLREAASHYESMERDVDFHPVESALGLKPTGETTYTPESVRSLADLIEPSGHECVPGKCGEEE